MNKETPVPRIQGSAFQRPTGKWDYLCDCEMVENDSDYHEMKTDLENAIRRGDELFDQSERAHKVNDRLDESNNSLADRLKERDQIIKELHALLDKHEIDHSDLSEFGYEYDD